MPPGPGEGWPCLGGGWGARAPNQAQPALPPAPQRSPAVHLRQSVPPGCEGRLPGSAGLRPVLDGAPHRWPGPLAACHPVLPAEGVLSPATQVGGAQGAAQVWPSLACPPPAHPNKELFNCSELRLPSPPQGLLMGSWAPGQASGEAEATLPRQPLPLGGRARWAAASSPLPHCAFGCASAPGAPGLAARAGRARAPRTRAWPLRDVPPGEQLGQAWRPDVHQHRSACRGGVFLAFKNI